MLLSKRPKLLLFVTQGAFVSGGGLLRKDGGGLRGENRNVYERLVSEVKKKDLEERQDLELHDKGIFDEVHLGEIEESTKLTRTNYAKLMRDISALDPEVDEEVVDDKLWDHLYDEMQEGKEFGQLFPHEEEFFLDAELDSFPQGVNKESRRPVVSADAEEALLEEEYRSYMSKQWSIHDNKVRSKSDKKTAKEVQMERYLSEMHHDMFMPLSCNDNVEADDCTSTLSSLVEGTAAGDYVTVPCGTCVTLDYTDGSTVNIPDGLNIEGKLYSPPSANVTLVLPLLFVQGVLKMDAPGPTNLVKFKFFGNDEIYFHPHAGNMHACDMATGCEVGRKPFLIAGGLLDINGIADSDNCPSWVKLRDTQTDPVNGMNVIDVGVQAASCWSAGHEILLTTPDAHYTHRETRTIVDTNPALGLLVLDSPLPDVFGDSSEAANSNYPEFAVEVASLSRRIILEAEHDDTTNDGKIGGHLMVLHTPTVAQKLEGVEIINFGQQGNLGRYPIHFHMCQSVSGSIVSKNVIRQSNQRCVVIHGTHNVRIFDNVAFEGFGHCFFTEDGIETGNTFERNLGAEISPPTFVLDGESDGEPAIFWITNTQNHWIGNVAAGTFEGIGIWFETHTKVRGPSYVGNEDYYPMGLPIGTFVNNTVHSSRRGIMTYGPGWKPETESILHNTNVYRNLWEGWLVHGNKNIAFVGGTVADNGKGIFNFRASNVRFEGIEIIGHSQEYATVVSKTGSWWWCPGDKDIFGLSIHSWMNLASDTVTMGTTAIDLTFRRFGAETGCTGSQIAAIHMEDIETQTFYDTPNRFSEIIFDGVMRRIDVCAPVVTQMTNINIEDVDGTLNPSGNPGFYVSNYPSMTTFADGLPCTPVSDTCDLAFCEGACLRQLTLRTDNSYATGDIEMFVTSGVTSFTDEFHHFAMTGSTFDHTYQGYDGKFGVTLPEGEYDIAFYDILTGNQAWPNYIEEEYLEEPLCVGFLTSVNILKPSWDASRCSNLIEGGDFEDSSFDAWQQHFAVINVTSPGADNSNYALRARDYPGANDLRITQWIDVTCIVADTPYQLSAKVRSEEEDGTEVVCDPAASGNCPYAQLATYVWDMETKTRTETKRNIGYVDPSQKDSDGYYSIEANVIFTEEEASATRAQIRLIQPLQKELIVDNVNMKEWSAPILPTDTAVDNVLSSADFISGVGCTWQDNRPPPNLIDGTGSKFLAYKVDGSNPGFEVIATQAACTIVQGINVYSASDGRTRDPSSFKIEGRVSSNDAYQLIAEGAITLPSDRNAEGIALEDMLHSETVSFDNTNSFAQYRVTFPSTVSASSTIMQVAEVQLPGILCSGEASGAAAAGAAPTTTLPAADEGAAPTTTLPGGAEGAAPTTSLPPAPTTTLTGGPGTTAPMVIGNIISGSAIVTGKNCTWTNRPPSNIHSGTGHKFLAIKEKYDGTDIFKPPVLEITPVDACTIATSIQIFTANDGWTRDPASVIVEGSLSLDGTYKVIFDGPLSLPNDRNAEATLVAEMSHQETIDFSSNSEPYSFYRISFPSTKSATSDKLQVAEIQLPGYVCDFDTIDLNARLGSTQATAADSTTTAAATTTTTTTTTTSTTTTSTTTIATTIAPVAMDNILTGSAIITSFDCTWTARPPSNVNSGDGYKFLSFKEEGKAPGIEIIPEDDCTILKGIKIYTANDGWTRDPSSVKIEGKVTADGPSTLIHEGALSLPQDRNAESLAVENMLHSETVMFSNNMDSYMIYRITFPSTKGATSTIMQIGEIELPGIICSGTTTL